MPNKERINGALNRALGFELQAIIQYVIQSVRVKGPDGVPNAPVFMDAAKQEMEHAEALIERIDFLGGQPVSYPATITIGGSRILELAAIGLKAEDTAQAAYQNLITIAYEENDLVTVRIAERILEDEQNHSYAFQTLLGTSDGPLEAPDGLADL